MGLVFTAGREDRNPRLAARRWKGDAIPAGVIGDLRRSLGRSRGALNACLAARFPLGRRKSPNSAAWSLKTESFQSRQCSELSRWNQENLENKERGATRCRRAGTDQRPLPWNCSKDSLSPEDSQVRHLGGPGSRSPVIEHAFSFRRTARVLVLLFETRKETRAEGVHS